MFGHKGTKAQRSTKKSFMFLSAFVAKVNALKYLREKAIGLNNGKTDRFSEQIPCYQPRLLTVVQYVPTQKRNVILSVSSREII